MSFLRCSWLILETETVQPYPSHCWTSWGSKHRLQTWEAPVTTVYFSKTIIYSCCVCFRRFLPIIPVCSIPQCRPERGMDASHCRSLSNISWKLYCRSLFSMCSTDTQYSVLNTSHTFFTFSLFTGSFDALARKY